jgi:hypothetical protein
MMSLEELPTDLKRASEFAQAEFDKGTVFWPRLLVRCLEASKRGAALTFLCRTYTRMIDRERDARVQRWLDELAAALDNTEDGQPAPAL